jgi:hypothetical protein
MKHVYLLCGFLLFGTGLWAQQADPILISGTFRHSRFIDFIEALEQQTPYRFYFQANDFDSLSVDFQAESLTLKGLMAVAFPELAITVAIDPGQRVFLLRGKDIRDALPKGFFEPADGEEASFDAIVYDFMGEQANKKVQEAEAKLYEIGRRTQNLNGTASIAGYVRDAASGEPMVGALVYIEQPQIGVSTNAFGFYTLTLPKGRHVLNIKSLGIKPMKLQVMLYADGKLDIETQEEVTPLKEVVIEGERDANIASSQMGLERIDVRTMKQIPMAFGEADILKVVLTLPGVKSVGESATGLNVRGGATDQNLILYNDATIYNPSHLFGFFSAFNTDVLKNVELYKSGVPAEYGGRLSSVLEVNTREGNKKKFGGSGGIGLVTGRLMLEGPIAKDKTSFTLGARSTYSDWLLRQIDNPDFNNSTAGFYDLNAHVSHNFDDKNTLFVTAYASNDQFRLNGDTLYAYQNQAASIKWKRVFNNQLFGVFSAISSRYRFETASDANPVNAYELDYSIRQNQLKADFSYFPSSNLTVNFGATSILYGIRPGNFRPLGSESLSVPETLAREQALESAVYVSARWELSPNLTLHGGLRYSHYLYLGPRDIINYAPGVPRSENTMTDTTRFGQGEIIKPYHGPELRLALRYGLGSASALKLSYNRMRQYISMLTNTQAIAPTDTWKLSDPYLRPQVGDQYAIGYYQNLRNNTIELSAEAYYKDLRDVLDFKSGAVLLLNPQVETDIIQARGRAYGVELLLKKTTGKLNGWVGYTYSRSLLRTESPFRAETINNGTWYPSNFDKPHDFTMISNYKFNRRISFSMNFTYSTGRPITLPLGRYVIDGANRLFYSDRNQFRIPDYYRADVSINLEGNHKIRKLAHSSWTLAVYNLTGRRNAFSVFFNAEGDTIRGYQLSIFGQPIPTLTYNFRF